MLLREATCIVDVNVIGVRKDVMTRCHFTMDTVETHCLMGALKAYRGTHSVLNFYLPPNNSVNYGAAVIDMLGQVDQDSFGGGDMIWVGTVAMQRLPQGSQGVMR